MPPLGAHQMDGPQVLEASQQSILEGGKEEREQQED
jgi:hypothetical protein